MRPVPAFDLGQHLIDIRGRTVVAHPRTYRPELAVDVPARLAPACLAQCAPNPLGEWHALPRGDRLEITELRLVEEDLEALTHNMSKLAVCSESSATAPPLVLERRISGYFLAIFPAKAAIFRQCDSSQYLAAAPEVDGKTNVVVSATPSVCLP